jgi:hypothetical protein
MKDIITFAVLIVALACTAYLATKSDSRTALFEDKGKKVIRLAQTLEPAPAGQADQPAPAEASPSR